MLDLSSQSLAQNLVNNKPVKNPRQLIRLAANNRVLFGYSLKHTELNKIKVKGKEWRKKLNATLVFLNKTLTANFLVIRTYKYIPYVTFDVDVFVSSEDYDSTISILRAAGCRIGSHDNSLGGRYKDMQKNAFKDELLTIDLHRDFTWQKRRFLDVSQMFKKTRRKKIENIVVAIPSPEMEFLLCMADIGHERFNITLLDIIWIEGLSHEITDWNLIQKQVAKHKWRRTYESIARIINTIAMDIYGKESIPFQRVNDKEYSLPYFLTFTISYISYFENVISTKKFPAISFAYMHYCRLRYLLSGKKRMPYYNDWYE